jgi:transcriptional regulator with XRE-family HTH domain
MEERLLKILKHYEHTPSSFADKLGVQRSSISHLLSGRNKPGFEFLSRLLAEFTDLNMEWFISGKGNMIKKIPSPPVNLTLFDQSPVMEKTSLNSESEIPVQDVNEVQKEVTNVIKVDSEGKNRVSKVILFFNDKSFEEFIPSEA